MDTNKRLSELLAERNMTIYQVSRLAEVSHSTLANARSRGGQLSVDTIERLCRVLGITLREFFTLPDDPAKNA